MKNNVKEYLKSIVKESLDTQFDEMALRPKVKDDGTLTRHDKTLPMTKPLWGPDNPTEPGTEGTPDAWLVNPKSSKWPAGTTFGTDEPFIVVPLGCDELETLKEKYGDWVKELESEHNVPVDFLECSRIQYPSAVKKALAGITWQPSGNKMSAQERMKRYDIYPVLKSFFGGEETLNEFNKRSIPIVPWDEAAHNRRKHENQYLEWSNDKIVYESHNANSYTTSEDFLDAALKRIRGIEDESAKTYHLGRQYNKKYSNWSIDKKNEKYWEGKQPIRGGNVRDYAQENLDVTVRMDLKLVGERVGPADFTWFITMETKIGKKLQEDRRIREGFLNDKQISVTKNVQLDSNKTYSDENPITSDFAVSQGLQELLNEFMEKLKSIQPKQILKVATVPSSFGNVETNNLQEQKERLANRIISKLKQ